nr:very short patch repair endonuclease [Streptomyces sp. SID161]
MTAQRNRDTAPELALRRALHALGFRYRVDLPIPGMPRRRADVTFTRWRTAVFVQGCFWHACPTHQHAPKHNSEWWRRKFDTNVHRDEENRCAPRAPGLATTPHLGARKRGRCCSALDGGPRHPGPSPGPAAGRPGRRHVTPGRNSTTTDDGVIALTRTIRLPLKHPVRLPLTGARTCPH